MEYALLYQSSHILSILDQEHPVYRMGTVLDKRAVQCWNKMQFCPTLSPEPKSLATPMQVAYC